MLSAKSLVSIAAKIVTPITKHSYVNNIVSQINNPILHNKCKTDNLLRVTLNGQSNSQKETKTDQDIQTSRIPNDQNKLDQLNNNNWRKPTNILTGNNSNLLTTEIVTEINQSQPKTTSNTSIKQSELPSEYNSNNYKYPLPQRKTAELVKTDKQMKNLDTSTHSPKPSVNVVNAGNNEQSMDAIKTVLPKTVIAPPSPLTFKKHLVKFWPTTVKSEWTDFNYEVVYSKVRKTGVPNYLDAKIPLPSGLNIPTWYNLLTDYHDNQLVNFLNYGWPVDYTYNRTPTPTFNNHKEPEDFSTHINKYITTELKHKALLGPFKNKPFEPWCQFSPIMTRKKKHSCDRRIIVDLSYPRGQSVNSGIKKGYYLGKQLSYTLPGINNIITKLTCTKTNKYLWTIDLERAYRQLRTDPLSVPLLGITFNKQMYLDIAPPFGCRTSSMACARTTDAVVYLLNNMGFDVICYLDDFIGVEDTYEKACKSYDCSLNLLKQLGLAVSYKKCIAPTQHITWLGYNIDSENNRIKIPEEKIIEIIDECKLWQVGSKVTRKYIQHVAGKLNFISKCVLATKTFMNRILEFLRNSPFKGTITVDINVMQDIKWFIHFASQFNGLILLPTKPKTTFIIECDACLSGGGAFSNGKYFSEVFTKEFVTLKLHIAQIESINLIAALVNLCPADPFQYDITIHTDNMSSQQVLDSGSGKDKILTACARFIWKFSALNNCIINIVHKPGIELVIADALSRAAINNSSRKTATEYCVNNNLTRVLVDHVKLYEEILVCM